MSSPFVLLQYVIVASAARTFVVKNSCAFTVCPGVFTDLSAGSATPNVPTGWEAAAGSSRSFSVPDNWTAGRIWGRRDCDFSSSSGADSCLTGGCDGGLECDPKTGTPTGPVTIAEWSLSASSGQDFYDVSLVDGFNLPMQIDNTGGCGTASCPNDLTKSCPSDLQGPTDANGTVIGCKSSCEVDSDPSNSPNCCTGDHKTPATCPASGVQDYAFFKSNCPDSIVFVYDESTGSQLPCVNSPDYTLTFCPSA